MLSPSWTWKFAQFFQLHDSMTKETPSNAFPFPTKSSQEKIHVSRSFNLWKLSVSITLKFCVRENSIHENPHRSRPSTFARVPGSFGSPAFANEFGTGFWEKRQLEADWDSVFFLWGSTWNTFYQQHHLTNSCCYHVFNFEIKKKTKTSNVSPAFPPNNF